LDQAVASGDCVSFTALATVAATIALRKLISAGLRFAVRGVRA
jgi:hypothetical protein